MSMTRKDYELLASAFATALARIEREHEVGRYTDDEASAAREGVFELRVELARQLADDNPRFDYSRFTKACGI